MPTTRGVVEGEEANSKMGLVAFSFVDVLVPLLLLDNGNNIQQQHTHHNRQYPSTVANIDIDNTASKMHRYPHGLISSGSLLLASAADDVRSSSNYVWNLPNGSVKFDSPFILPDVSSLDDGQLSSSRSAALKLWNPTLLGSGGSGAVFSFSASPTQRIQSDSSTTTASSNKQSANDDNTNIAIKVSWKRSRSSVEKECNILQTLESVPHVERCLGRPISYPYEEGRTMIALSPVVISSTSSDGITSSLTNVTPGKAQLNCVRSIVQTMMGMLKLGVYTVDVQPLINVNTGETLFIDFTEANSFSNPVTPSDEAALVGYCGEMIALIPDSLRDVAVEYLRSELDSNLNNINSSTPLPEKVTDILESVWFD